MNDMLARILIILLFSFLMMSCAEVTSLEKNGIHNRYEVECTGKLVSMDVCYKKAAKLCPNGYRVLNRDVEQRNPFLPQTEIGIGINIANSIPGVVKGINIECK